MKVVVEEPFHEFGVHDAPECAEVEGKTERVDPRLASSIGLRGAGG